MTRSEAELFKRYGCTVITITDAALVLGGCRQKGIDAVFDAEQNEAGFEGVPYLTTGGSGYQRYDDIFSYGRVLKDGDWEGALRELTERFIQLVREEAEGL
jgi:hypothetical protein